MNSDNSFQVVMKRSLYNTGKLQARFSKIGLMAGPPQPVGAALFQSCLLYTLLARIAPSWNKAGPWLIQGRDFLTHHGYLNAIKMELIVSCEQIHLSLVATTVRFPALQLGDIEILARSQQKFLEDHSFVIPGESIGSPWCHVLPSMKRGEIVGIGRQLPVDGPFRSYKDIKRYWKNSYGYRLPENEDDRIYYQVHFRPLGPRIFTYPDVCLRSRDIHPLPRVDPRPVLVSFLQDLKVKMSSLCGTKLHLQPRANYLLTELNSGTQKEKSNHDSSNLSSRNKVSKKVIYRNFPTQSQQATPSNGSSRTPSVLSQVENGNTVTTQQNKGTAQRSHVNQQPTTTTPHNPSDLTCGSMGLSNSVNNRKDAENQGSTRPQILGTSTNIGSANSSTPRNIRKAEILGSTKSSAPSIRRDTGVAGPSLYQTPCTSTDLGSAKPQTQCVTNRRLFQPSQSGQTDLESCSSSSTEHRIIPKFVAKKSITSVTKPASTPGSVSAPLVPVFKARVGGGQKKTPEASNVTGVPSTAPQSEALTSVPSSLCTPSDLQPIQTSQTPVYKTPSFAKIFVPKNPSQAKTPTALHMNPVRAKTPAFAQRNPSSQVRTPTLVNKTPSLTTPKSTPKQTVAQRSTPSHATPRSTPSHPVSGRVMIGAQSHGMTPGSIAGESDDEFTTPSQPTSTKKRGASEDPASGPSAAKKPRSKPTVQDVDVEALAREGQLSKVNSITLMTWLRGRGLQCKSKDKKPELIAKVLCALNVRVREP